MSALAPASVGQAPQSADVTGVLYERYAGRIFGYCLSLLGSREDAEDAVQTTFVNAQRGLGRGVIPQFELAWLVKIARNVCYNAHASSARRGRIETSHDLDALQDLLATPERGAGVSVGDLTHALAAIPERQRRALLLREFQGLSYDEMAAELGVSVAAVETLLFRARRAVAEQLERGGTTRRSGLVSSLVAFFRWFFQGGAAPLKVAAATATLATTATLAITPLVSGHHRAPAPVAPGLDRSHVIREPARTSGPLSSSPAQRAPARRAVVRASTPPAEASSATTRASVGRDKPPSAKAPAGTGSSSGDPAPPDVALPSLTLPLPVPAITAPLPAGTVPEISLPPVDVPPLDLAVDTPTLPDLPKLP